MHELSEEDIERIDKDLEKKGIVTPDLRAGLLDHICCILEKEIKSGESVEMHYEKILKRFYKKELKEIETETQLAITYKNYYAMKKTMLVSGIFSAIGFVTGGILKYFFLPGAAFSLIIGFSAFALLFLPLLILLKMQQKTEGQNKLLLMISLLASSPAVIGVLFKIMHWPFANMLMIIGFLVFTFLYIPINFYHGYKERENRMIVTINTILFIGVAGVLFSLVNLRPSRTYNTGIMLADSLLRNNLELSGKFTDKHANADDQLKQAINEFKQLSAALILKIQLAEGDGKNPVSLTDLSVNNNFASVDLILFDNKNGQQKINAENIRLALEKVEQIAIEKGIAIKIISDNQTSENGEKIKWEDYFFKDNPVSTAVRKLQLLEMRLNLIP